MEESEALQVVLELLSEDSAPPEAIASLRDALKEAREARLVREALIKLYGAEGPSWAALLSTAQAHAEAAGKEASQKERIAGHLGCEADWDAIADHALDLVAFEKVAVRWKAIGDEMGIVDGTADKVLGRIRGLLDVAVGVLDLREVFDLPAEGALSVVGKLKSVPERWANALGRNDCPGVEEMLAETRSLRGLRDELARDWGCAPEDLPTVLDEATTWASVGEHLGFMGGNKMSVKARIAELRKLSREAAETLRCDPVDILGDLSAKLEDLKTWRVAAQQAEADLARASHDLLEEIAKVSALRDEVAAYRAVLAAEIRRVS